MVGYILGLGDRHPCNLMLDQLSGRVLHIDFGDCFEMAMNREKYPEKVPFRLTRMLIKAMEVSGIEGSYRSTCERTMTVLRDSRDSLVAMLEAFVYDPLISWRLAGLSGREVSSGGDTPDEATGMFASDLPSSNDTITNSVKEGGFRLSVLHESIAEGLNEEDDDGYEAKPKVCPLRSNTLLTGCSASLSERIHAGNTFENSSVGPDGGTSVARARSLQMFSSIKVLAANLSASYRIASVIGEGGNSQLHAAAEGSLSQSHFARSLRQREATIGNPGITHEEALNEKALKVIRRVQDKLSGMDFPDVQLNNEPLAVTDQVQRLIVQATSSENLCQLFIGWCAFW
jgi:phosphatidylinositol kinase/protein kinase (PI-3  family)